MKKSTKDKGDIKLGQKVRWSQSPEAELVVISRRFRLRRRNGVLPKGCTVFVQNGDAAPFEVNISELIKINTK